jgi:pimeloyl-ACP methyl ester carboxylesterase
VVQSRELLEALRAVVLPALGRADQGFVYGFPPNYSVDVDALPEPFAAPALIITGRFDSMCGYREAWRILGNYPRGTYAVLDRAGHALAAEQKALYRALVNEWLDRVEEYASLCG